MTWIDLGDHLVNLDHVVKVTYYRNGDARIGHDNGDVTTITGDKGKVALHLIRSATGTN